MNHHKPLASLSLDLDNEWSYLKTHGDAGWKTFPTYLDVFIPSVLMALERLDLKITFFIVGQDAVDHGDGTRGRKSFFSSRAVAAALFQR
jgi:peptidoglycan/xylan/chitin deacetylase (PgdA/CDA1 family)